MIGEVQDISVLRFIDGESTRELYKLRVEFVDGSFDEIIFQAYLLEAKALASALDALGQALEKRHNALLKEKLGKI